jgi:mannose-1-phosphate guanylyltransferase
VEHICGMQRFLLALKSIQNAFKQHATEIHELFIQGNDVYNTNLEVHL